MLYVFLIIVLIVAINISFNSSHKKPIRIANNTRNLYTNPNVIVGESHYKSSIRKLEHGGIYNAELLLEPNNPYDKNAVKVVVEGLHVGYIGRPYQSEYKGVRELEVVAFVNVQYPAVAPI